MQPLAFIIINRINNVDEKTTANMENFAFMPDLAGLDFEGSKQPGSVSMFSFRKNVFKTFFSVYWLLKANGILSLDILCRLMFLKTKC